MIERRSPAFPPLPPPFLFCPRTKSGWRQNLGRSPFHRAGNCVAVTFREGLQSLESNRLAFSFFFFWFQLALMPPHFPFPSLSTPRRDLTSYSDIPRHPVEPYHTLRNLEVAKGCWLSLRGTASLPCCKETLVSEWKCE